MNGIFDKQTSGNEWTPSLGSMLHEAAQNSVAPERIRRQSVVFVDLEQQMARHEEEYLMLISEISRIYVIPRDNSVQQFLSSHRVLPQLLLQAFPHLQRHFGVIVFALRATSDDQGWQRLYVDAMWTGSSEDAFQAIDRFQDDWWLNNLQMAAGHLTFTYRLV